VVVVAVERGRREGAPRAGADLARGLADEAAACDGAGAVAGAVVEATGAGGAGAGGGGAGAAAGAAAAATIRALSVRYLKRKEPKDKKTKRDYIVTEGAACNVKNGRGVGE
jgi:hypothetical protein